MTDRANPPQNPPQNADTGEKRIRMLVKQFSSVTKTVSSQAQAVRDVSWRFSIMPKTYPEKEGKKCLGFFVQCAANSYADGWTCKADAEMRLIAQKAGVPNFIRKAENHIYTSKETDWGYTCFMNWADIIDEKRGYIKDDSILVEVLIRCDYPQNIMTRDKFVQAINQWFNLAEHQLAKGLTDLAIQANEQGIQFCKGKDKEMKEKLVNQKERLLQKKVLDSITRIETGDGSSKILKPRFLRQGTSSRNVSKVAAPKTPKKSSKSSSKLSDREDESPERESSTENTTESRSSTTVSSSRKPTLCRCCAVEGVDDDEEEYTDDEQSECRTFEVSERSDISVSEEEDQGDRSCPYESEQPLENQSHEDLLDDDVMLELTEEIGHETDFSDELDQYIHAGCGDRHRQKEPSTSCVKNQPASPLMEDEDWVQFIRSICVLKGRQVLADVQLFSLLVTKFFVEGEHNLLRAPSKLRNGTYTDNVEKARVEEMTGGSDQDLFLQSLDFRDCRRWIDEVTDKYKMENTGLRRAIENMYTSYLQYRKLEDLNQTTNSLKESHLELAVVCTKLKEMVLFKKKDVKVKIEESAKGRKALTKTTEELASRAMQAEKNEAANVDLQVEIDKMKEESAELRKDAQNIKKNMNQDLQKQKKDAKKDASRIHSLELENMEKQKSRKKNLQEMRDQLSKFVEKEAQDNEEKQVMVDVIQETKARARQAELNLVQLKAEIEKMRLDDLRKEAYLGMDNAKMNLKLARSERHRNIAHLNHMEWCRTLDEIKRLAELVKCDFDSAESMVKSGTKCFADLDFPKRSFPVLPARLRIDEEEELSVNVTSVSCSPPRIVTPAAGVIGQSRSRRRGECATPSSASPASPMNGEEKAVSPFSWPSPSLLEVELLKTPKTDWMDMSKELTYTDVTPMRPVSRKSRLHI